MQVVVNIEKICERYLLPALCDLLDTFLMSIRGFRSDNGPEYLNKRVATLLGKLLIELTKSRRARVTTMPWWKAKMALWCVNGRTTTTPQALRTTVQGSQNQALSTHQRHPKIGSLMELTGHFVQAHFLIEKLYLAGLEAI